MEDQDLTQQDIDVYEGGSISVQETEVVGPERTRVCLLSMINERESVMKEVHYFYTKFEGNSWNVANEKYC